MPTRGRQRREDLLTNPINSGLEKEAAGVRGFGLILSGSLMTARVPTPHLCSLVHTAALKLSAGHGEPLLPQTQP